MLYPQIELAYISSQSSETYVISCISLVRYFKSKEFKKKIFGTFDVFSSKGIQALRKTVYFSEMQRNSFCSLVQV